MSSTVAIIGSGNIGAGLAKLSVAAGIDVIISNSRGPETLCELVTELGPRARAATPHEAAEAADLVVLALPLPAYRSLSASALAGKVVIDAMNHYPQHTGPLPELDEAGVPSSRFLQSALPDAKIVKAFNNVDFVRLPRIARPAGDSDRAALPVAGDDEQAKHAAAAYLDAIGYDFVDLGDLDESWRSQPGQPLYVQPYSRDRDGITDPFERFMTAEAIQAPASRIEELAAAADSASRP